MDFLLQRKSHLFYLKWNNSKCFLRLSVWRSCCIFCFTGHRQLAKLMPHNCPSALNFCACPYPLDVCALQRHSLLYFAEILAHFGKDIYDTTKKTRKEKGDFLGSFCPFKFFFLVCFSTNFLCYVITSQGWNNCISGLSYLGDQSGLVMLLYHPKGFFCSPCGVCVVYPHCHSSSLCPHPFPKFLLFPHRFLSAPGIAEMCVLQANGKETDTVKTVTFSSS